jgi:hypothetical protein
MDHCPFCGGPLTSERVEDRRSLWRAYRQAHPDKRNPVEREAGLIWGAMEEGVEKGGCANSCFYGCGSGCLIALVTVAAVVLPVVLVLI